MTTSKHIPILCFAEEEKNPQNLFKLLIPTLQDTANAQLVLSLWLQKFNETASRPFNCKRIRDLMSEVYNMLFCLSVKYSLKQKLFRRNEYVCKELYTFCQHMMYSFELANISWCEFSNIKWHWSRGTIDYAKTIETIINCDALRSSKRYIIASVYGFEDRIADLAAKTNLPVDGYDVCYLTTRIFHDRRHPLMLSYWDCNDDGGRKAMVDEWLGKSIKYHRIQDICFLLAMLSEKMLKQVLITWKDELLKEFANNIFQDDYFWQIAMLVSKVTNEEDTTENSDESHISSASDSLVYHDMKTGITSL